MAINIYFNKVKDIEESEGPSKQLINELELKAVVDVISAKCGTAIDINELRVDTLTKIAVSKLFKQKTINEELINNILVNFYTNLRTSQKEETKYIFVFKIQNRVIISHCILEKGIVRTRTKIKVSDILLNQGNIIRYVEFIDVKDEGIFVKYWDRHHSDFFERYLGIKPSQNVFGEGAIRLRSEYMGLPCFFELSEQDLERYFIIPELEGSESSYEILDGRLQYNVTGESILIKEIRKGRNKFKNIDNLKEKYIEAKYDLDTYHNIYRNLYFTKETLVKEAQTYLTPSTTSERYVDYEHKLVKLQQNQEIIVTPKVRSSFIVTFVDQHISIDKDFLKNIINKIISGEELKLYHGCLPFSHKPNHLGNLSVFNSMKTEEWIIRLVDQLYEEYKGLTGKIEKVIILFSIYYLLANYEKSNIKVLFSEIYGELRKELVSHNKKISSVEGDIFEFKDRDWLATSKSDEELAKRMTVDINEKISKNNVKIYFIGVTDDRKLDLIPSAKWPSDRLGNLKKKMKEKLENTQISLFPLDLEREKFLLFILAYQTKK
ncbi:MAG TPA: hypothetical protein VJH92_03995 [Candidatus Nanoarchaeia archaeon]|nr:hypothetical protein [Candidatus Nanoarchaeia archaeon]